MMARSLLSSAVSTIVDRAVDEAWELDSDPMIQEAIARQFVRDVCWALHAKAPELAYDIADQLGTMGELFQQTARERTDNKAG